METRCNGSVPGWNRTRNRPGNLDPLLTLVRAIRNTRVFLMETRVVADALLGSDTLRKMMDLSLHSTSSQTLLEASSVSNTLC